MNVVKITAMNCVCEEENVGRTWTEATMTETVTQVNRVIRRNEGEP
jgi:hypothetical protein